MDVNAAFRTPAVQAQWRAWRESFDSLKNYVADTVPSELAEWEAGADMVLANFRRGFPGFSPTSILDLGCSNGMKAVAIQRAYPGAAVTGIDPEADAIRFAQSLSTALHDAGNQRVPDYHVGFGENLPFPSATFDAVVCITVLEHVQDVDRCIAEVHRVLKPGGVFYIEAPNYLWPFEGHLQIVVPPLGPKWAMKLCAHLQGRGAEAGFVDHLKLLTPRLVQRSLDRHGFKWENMVAQKLDRVLCGKGNDVVTYRRLGKILSATSKSGLGGVVSKAILASSFYPSLMYAARKA